ncbi:MAG: winged helix-turn-helix transcriptional regulator [Rhizobiales bacterium]|nr:winged helix-turn-helix transcriptional regulator [Hyphomicrobiales bacterium]MBI3672704.1 winged helix-turn-helix transcriptional regulator [Hyphomicrobiales bacterium]
MATADSYDLDRIFHALADPTRRSILRQIAEGEHSISAIARPHDLTFAAISKHLKVLERARLIGRRKDGSFQMISLNPEALKNADRWLSYYQKFWNLRLEALKDLLERKERP